MNHTFIGIARQRRVMMEPCVRPENMICNKKIRVAHRFHCLDKLTYGSRIGTEFCLGKNRSDFHSVSPFTNPVAACFTFLLSLLFTPDPVSEGLTNFQSPEDRGCAPNCPVCRISTGPGDRVKSRW